VNGGVGVGTENPLATLHVYDEGTLTPGATKVIIQAGTNQSGVNLLEWQNNSGDQLGVIRPDGSVVLVYAPPTRLPFFAVANTSGVPLIGIGPTNLANEWGVAVYDPTAGQLRAGMGKVASGEWRMGVGDLGAQNGVLLSWVTGAPNEPRIVVANGSLATPVFLVDREGDVTVRGTTVELPNIPSSSTATEVLVWESPMGEVKRRAASGLISGLAWALTGNSITSAWNGSSGSFLGTTNDKPLVIATTNTASPQPIQFWTNNIERMRITAAGEVVVQNQDLLGTPTTTVLQVLGGNNGTGATQVIIQAGANQGTVDMLQWQDNSGTILGVIDRDGLVGIGTATPRQKLHVVGTGSGSAVFVNGGVGVGTESPLATLHVYDQGTLTPGATQVIIQAGANQGTVDLLQWQDNSGTILGVIDRDGLVGIGTATPRQKLHVVGTGSGSAVFVNGGVGVGTESPLATLHVYDQGTLTPGATQVIIQAGANQGTVDLLQWQDNSGTILGVIDRDGLVGIGTATPRQKLHVVGTGSGSAVFVNGGVGVGTESPLATLHVYDQGTLTPGATQVIIQAGANQGTVDLLQWQDNSGTILGVIDRDGLVGIGTATPRQKLHVVGTGSGSAVFVNGGVGVGTENPLATLHVYDEGTLTPGATKVIIQAGTNQSGVNLLEWQNNSGDQLGVIRPDGSVVLVYAPPTRLPFFAVANTSGVPLIGIGPTNLANEWGVAVYDPTAGQLRAGMGKVASGEWRMGVGDLGAQNGVLLSWVTGAPNEPRIVVANGSLATPVFLVDREGDVTVRGTTVELPNIPSSSTATEVLVWESPMGEVKRRAASGLISGLAWALTGNSITSAWNGTSGNFLGTTNAQPLVIATTTPQPIQFWTNNIERMRITETGNVGIGTNAPARRLAIVDAGVGLDRPAANVLALYTNNTERMRITATGNVGIGTTAPARRLAIVDAGVGLDRPAANVLALYTNNTERMRITATGEVVVQNQALTGATKVIIQAGTNQSGVNLLEWQNNSGDQLGVIRPDGSVVLVYAPPTRLPFFAVANTSGVPLIGIGPNLSGDWGVAVYDDATGQLRAGMGKVGTEWQMGVGDLAAQNGVLLNWATTGTVNEPRIVVANGSLATPVFLVDREGDVTVRGTTVSLPNILSGSTATEVLVWNAGNVQRRSAEGLAWLLTGNSGTNPAVNFLGTTDAQPLVIRVNNAQTFQFNTNLSLQRDAGGNTRGQGAVDLQSARSAATQVASGDYSVIGGGLDNTASGFAATVGGGYHGNTASGSYATVGGGLCHRWRGQAALGTPPAAEGD
jgi:hypothetical protein